MRCFVDAKTPHPTCRQHQGADVRAALLADLRLFDPHFSEGETRVGETVVLKQTAWALSLFLTEFPHALSLPLPSHAAGEGSTPPSPAIGSSGKELLQSHLDCLSSLRRKQSDTAKRCRASDSLRGRKIIADYDAVHPPFDQDEVLRALGKEEEDLRTEVAELLDSFVE
jgi:hypothetical protein